MQRIVPVDYAIGSLCNDLLQRTIHLTRCNSSPPARASWPFATGCARMNGQDARRQHTADVRTLCSHTSWRCVDRNDIKDRKFRRWWSHLLEMRGLKRLYAGEHHQDPHLAYYVDRTPAGQIPALAGRPNQLRNALCLQITASPRRFFIVCVSAGQPKKAQRAVSL